MPAYGVRYGQQLVMPSQGRRPEHTPQARQGVARRSGSPEAVRTAADRPPEAPEREVLVAAVERVTYHNPENGVCVLGTRVRRYRDLVTVVGHAATVAPEEWITATGEWVNDRTRGQQFRAGSIRTAEPTSLEGIERYLGSAHLAATLGTSVPTMPDGRLDTTWLQVAGHTATDVCWRVKLLCR